MSYRLFFYLLCSHFFLTAPHIFLLFRGLSLLFFCFSFSSIISCTKHKALGVEAKAEKALCSLFSTPHSTTRWVHELKFYFLFRANRETAQYPFDVHPYSELIAREKILSHRSRNIARVWIFRTKCFLAECCFGFGGGESTEFPWENLSMMLTTKRAREELYVIVTRELSDGLVLTFFPSHSVGLRGAWWVTRVKCGNVDFHARGKSWKSRCGERKADFSSLSRADGIFPMRMFL